MRWWWSAGVVCDTYWNIIVSHFRIIIIIFGILKVNFESSSADDASIARREKFSDGRKDWKLFFCLDFFTQLICHRENKVWTAEQISCRPGYSNNKHTIYIYLHSDQMVLSVCIFPLRRQPWGTFYFLFFREWEPIRSVWAWGAPTNNLDKSNFSFQ